MTIVINLIELAKIIGKIIGVIAIIIFFVWFYHAENKGGKNE